MPFLELQTEPDVLVLFESTIGSEKLRESNEELIACVYNLNRSKNLDVFLM